ncbi:MAG: TonB-dependent receptor, partial [Epsilonproteobacteria bacterium]|nr:TonB-dependent receptor [Campylobacterota bacterium]
MKSILLSLIATNLIFAQTQLQDIEVTATYEEESEVPIQKESFLPDAPMQKQITTKQALSIPGTNGDPIKALKSFAGVVSTNNDDASEIYIHGSKPRETTYSINHLPLGYIFHLGGLHSVIAPEATGQIDAYLGGFDTTYDAMGAVVDVMPKYPTGSNKGRVHLGMYDADFAYDMKLGEDTALFIGGRRSYFDLIATKVMDSLEQDEDDKSKETTFTLFPQFYDAQMILSHNVGNHAFSLEAITAEDSMKLNTTMNKTRDPVANGKINSTMGFTTLGVRWNYFGDSFNSMTLLSHLKTTQELHLFDADFFVDTSSTANTLYHETIFDIENHKPLIGFEVSEMKAPLKAHITNPPSSDDFEPLITDQEVVDLSKTFRAKSYALFVQDTWDISEDNHFRFGARAWETDFQEFGGGVDPRFAFVHDFDDSLTASVAIGRYSQFPETTYVIEGFGNPKIDTTEFSNHYTANITKSFEDKSSLTVEPYYKTFENLAISDERTKYEAVGEGEAYGVDVTYQKKIDKFDMIVAYTYVNAKRQLNTDNSKQYRFEGDIPHTLQFNTTYRFDNEWRLSSLFKYNSGRPYTPIVGTEEFGYEGEDYKRPLYGEPYSKRMPSSIDLDIQVGKSFKYADGELEFAIELMNINTL